MRDASRCVRHVLLFPLLAFVYMFTSGRFAASFDIPMARFMSHTASYASFLGAVVAYRLLSENTFIGSICEFYVFTYIMGLALERYLMFTRLGFKQYFSFWWRWFDFVLLGAFGVAFFFRIEAFLVTRPYFLHTISRVHWSAFEYVIYYEIFLTAGYILSVWKMFYYFQLLKRLGVSVMTVGRCVGKLFNYLLLMGIVMVSFAVGLNMLMKPLVLQSSASSHYAFESSADFRIPWAVKSLYWSFYGYLDPISYKVAGSGGGGNLLPVSNIAAELFVGFYHVAIIIVLLNLITALLVKTADEIQENEEMEYKYTRVVIYSEFLTWEMSLPPPFNLIYVPLSFISRSVKSAYVLGWPELVMQRDCCDGSEEDTEMFTYYQVLKRMYYRFRAGKDINYRPAVKQESELDEEKLGIIMLMNTLETSTAGTANVDTKEEPFKRRRIRKLE